MKEWQFDILFFVGVGGALTVLIGPEFGLKIGQNPTAVTGIGAILTYVLTQRGRIVNKPDKKETPKKDGGTDDESG